MLALIELDGSQPCEQAIGHALAALERDAERGLVLLHVSPSGRVSDLERGKFLLEGGRRAAEIAARGVQVRTRLEVGDPDEKLPAVAQAEGADLVVAASHGANGFPNLERLGQHALRLLGQCPCRLLLISPDGQPVALRDEEREPTSEAA